MFRGGRRLSLPNTDTCELKCKCSVCVQMIISFSSLLVLLAGDGVEIYSCKASGGIKGHRIQEHVCGCGILYLNFEKNVVLCKSCGNHMIIINT